MPSAPPLVRLDSTPGLVDRVYRALLNAISEGTLPPGQHSQQASQHLANPLTHVLQHRTGAAP